MSDINIIRKNGVTTVVIDDDVKITETSQLLDIMATARYTVPECEGLIIKKDSLPEAFFDLKTRFAGEILQKFSNYRVKLAIVGDFGYYSSKALADFIRECNRGSLVFFVQDMDEAIARLEDK